MSLRILYLGLLPPHPGGAPISCAELLAGFAGQGLRVRALAPVTPDTWDEGEALARGDPQRVLSAAAGRRGAGPVPEDRPHHHAGPLPDGGAEPPRVPRRPDDSERGRPGPVRPRSQERAPPRPVGSVI